MNRWNRRKRPAPSSTAKSQPSLFGAPGPPGLDHRCAICGTDRAWWGFGPPLVPREVWACMAHRDEVEALSAPPRATVGDV